MASPTIMPCSVSWSMNLPPTRSIAIISRCRNELRSNSRNRSTIQPDRLDDLVEIVRHGDGPVGEGSGADAATAEHLVELLLVGRVVGDRRRWIFQLVASEDAHHALV